jgi:beta-glucosidase/6-phospho-beta-glucosidase/beta-galactosidase
MDNLRLAYVEEHIAKMNAAIELDESQQLLDRRL